LVRTDVLLAPLPPDAPARLLHTDEREEVVDAFGPRVVEVRGERGGVKIGV
jgi:hypothetical protein